MITFKTLSGLRVSVNPRYLHQVVENENAHTAIVVTDDAQFEVDPENGKLVIQNMSLYLAKHAQS